MEKLTNLFESIGYFALVIIGIVAYFIFRQIMLQWRWQFWNKNTFMTLDPQAKDEDMENLQKLKDRGCITDEQYDEAVCKLQKEQSPLT